MFVYSVSHDLRSPLVNLQGFSKELGAVRDDLRALLQGEPTESARKQAREMIEHDISEPIHFIQTAVTRLSVIIDALLRLSRAGRVEYQPELVDLSRIIARIVEAMNDTITRRGVTLIRPEKLPPVWGDPTALEQVFANLIQNAVNYLDPARPGRIEIGSVDESPPEMEGACIFFVRDNGLGIPEAHLPKVFTIFQRLHANVAPGEGIGLALVRRMVERHGGLIWVDSVAGAGSTFYVALPGKEKSPLIIAPRKESIRLVGPIPPKP
jgi:signal transduction histidine kinase